MNENIPICDVMNDQSLPGSRDSRATRSSLRMRPIRPAMPSISVCYRGTGGVKDEQRVRVQMMQPSPLHHRRTHLPLCKEGRVVDDLGDDAGTAGGRVGVQGPGDALELQVGGLEYKALVMQV